jgi:hypothetical protein
MAEKITKAMTLDDFKADLRCSRFRLSQVTRGPDYREACGTCRRILRRNTPCPMALPAPRSIPSKEG